MISKHSVVIADPVRTAIGTFGGRLKDIPAVELGAIAISAALERSRLRLDEIGTVVMGNAVQAGNKVNPARQAPISASPSFCRHLNRVCGSGAQATVSAAHEILMGSVDAAIGGDMENMDAAPYLVQRGRWGHRTSRCSRRLVPDGSCRSCAKGETFRHCHKVRTHEQ